MENTTAKKTVRIKIDPVIGYDSFLSIKDINKKPICMIVRPGSVIEIEIDKPMSIRLCGLFGITMCMTIISPNGTCKYRATWGQGLFGPKIVSCSEVDAII